MSPEYPSREYDTETGMYFYRARYYDPKAGRFVTKDPIGFAGGDVNLFIYVKNSPVNFVDPSGNTPAGNEYQEPSESKECNPFKDCVDKCIRDNYGKSYEIAKSLTPLSLLHALQEMYNEFTMTLAKDTMKALPGDAANTNGNILEKIAAANKAEREFQRLSPMTKILGRLGKASNLLGAGALGYVAGAIAYCSGYCATK